jgi:hypothetical protein
VEDIGNDFDEDATQAAWDQLAQDERHRMEDEALERHRKLFEEFRREGRVFDEHCEQFANFMRGKEYEHNR